MYVSDGNSRRELPKYGEHAGDSPKKVNGQGGRLKGVFLPKRVFACFWPGHVFEGPVSEIVIENGHKCVKNHVK